MRFEKYTAMLKSINADAAVVSRPENMRWLSGYTGEGCLFACREARVIVTDFRYIEQAERQAPGWRVERTGIGRQASDICKELADEFGAKAIAVEGDYLTHDEYVTLTGKLTGAEIISLSGGIEKLREVKDDSEIASIIEAAKIACAAFDRLLNWVKPGMTEREVQIRLDYDMLQLGSEKNAFSTIACAGPNGSLPHAIPSDRPIEKGELLTLDFGAAKNGYLSDMTRTVGIGKVSDELKKLYNTVLESQLLVLDNIAPGKVCEDMDKLARDYLEARYPGAFGHSLGHGVGLFIHEMPRLAMRSKTVLAKGHVVTVEPGVYIPGLGGCRIEDMAIITADGYIDPIDAPKRLIEL